MVHKIKSGDEQGYQGWSNWDTWETKLIIDNDEQLYNWQLAWKKNWDRKIKRGVFDMNKAEMVVAKYIIPVVRGTRKMWFKDITVDPDIDPKKVNKREIVEAILEME